MGILNLRITGRLFAGFAAVATVLVCAVAFTLVVVSGVGQNVDRMVNLRVPVALESTQLVGNLYSTLATLRGYLLTGNPQGKADRAAMWKEMDATTAQFDKMAELFTNPENKRKWAEAKAVLGEFRAAQDKAEAVAFTPDAYPATKLLLTEAAPKVQVMFSELTKMINEEEGLEATPERKRLLKAMADARGNLAAAAAQLRMFLLSGDKSDRESFAAPWANFERAFATLNAQRNLFDAAQKASFDAIVRARTELAPLPDRMFAIRESAQWNMPVHILVTEAAPRALKLLDLIDGTKQADGTRSGGIKTNQQAMLAMESQEVASGISFLKMVEWLLLVVGIAAAAAIAFFTARSVATPIRNLTAGMRELASGNFDVVLPGLGRKDEIGEIAGAVDEFKVLAAEKARREAEEKIEQDKRAEAEREAAMQRMAQEFEAAVGGLVKAAVAGDFSRRVDLQGKTGLVLNVGTALNSLCENVAGALDDLIQMLNALAEGDLSQRITAEYQGNFAVLKDNANMTAERIGATIAEIKSSAREVTNASSEISTSTTDLSQRTEEQAASLEETSASMEQISSTVKKNAENAQQANQSASGARQVADRGGQVVAQAVEAMARIEESSRKISDIIGVIDEIARQTNLLALNAAVEAARAGDAGRGFAVVASEVRSLAQRSSQAAKDIKDLITNSNGQVQEGVNLVNDAGKALAEIVESIKTVAGIVSDIASASNEQATGIDQINKAITQMDEVTQQNSALVEENAATAKTLEQQAAAMDERVAFFRLDDNEPISGPPRVVAAVPGRNAVASRPAAPMRKQAAAGGRGPVGRMQAALATAVNKDPDWKEF